jgi:hypothetical protein
MTTQTLPQKLFFLHEHIKDLELHPKLKQLLVYTILGKKPPKDLFDEISYNYYLSYIKPKISRAIKNKDHDIQIYVSPNYMIYSIPVFYNPHQRTYYYNYILGIDNDEIFVNRIYLPPSSYQSFYIRLADNIVIILTDNDAIYNTLGYDIDMGEREEVVIEAIPYKQPPHHPVSIRVQGDIVLQLVNYNNTNLTWYIPTDPILNHVTILLIDIINRILLDYGLSTRIIDNIIYLPSVAPRKNDTKYLSKLASLLHKRLEEVMGKEEIELYVDEHHTIYEMRVKSPYNCRVACFTEGGGLNNPYNHIGVRVDCLTYPEEPALLVRELLNEVIEAINNTPPSNYEFNIGNHFIRLTNVKSLSFSYRPARQPITLNEHIINVRNPRTFIVFPNSVIEMQHPQHGLKTIRFKDSFIVRLEHIQTHENFTRERNRVVLRNLKL